MWIKTADVSVFWSSSGLICSHTILHLIIIWLTNTHISAVLLMLLSGWSWIWRCWGRVGPTRFLWRSWRTRPRRRNRHGKPEYKIRQSFQYSLSYKRQPVIDLFLFLFFVIFFFTNSKHKALCVGTWFCFLGVLTSVELTFNIYFPVCFICRWARRARW